MKKLFIYIIPFILISCAEENYHNGVYKATIINPSNFYDLHYEILKVDGNRITSSKYTIGGQFAGENIVDCKQFPDRVEFTENNTTKVLKYRETDNSLRLNDFVVFKYLGAGGEITITKPQPRPLIKDNGNGTITPLPTEKPSTIKRNEIVQPEIRKVSDTTIKSMKPKAVMQNKNDY